jgi:hypothetical protein
MPGVSIEQNNCPMMSRKPAMSVFRVHGGDLGAQEQRLVQNPCHHAKQRPRLTRYWDNETVRLLAPP